MEKGSVGRVLLGILVLAAGAGAVVAYVEMSAVRQELRALQGKVAQLERKGAEPTTSAPAAVTPVALPAATGTPAETAQEVAALKARIEAMEVRVAGGGPEGGGALDRGAIAVTAAGVEEAAKIASMMSEDAKKAIAAVVKETLEQRDRERTAGWTSRGADRMLDRLAQELALSESQKALLKPILDERAKKMADLFTSGNLDRETMRTQIDGLRKETDEAIKRHLTSEQARKYDEVAAQNGGMGWFGGGRMIFDAGGRPQGGGAQGGGGR